MQNGRSVAALQRRRRREGSDIQSLVAQLGGDSAVPAIYDRRFNVASSGGVVDTIDDARGATGFGPQLVGAATARPTWDATNLLATFDGTNDAITSALSALFNMGAGTKSIVLGAAVTEALAGREPAILSNGAVSLYMGHKVQVGPVYGAVVGGTEVDATSLVATGATRRCTFATASSATSVAVEVLAQAAVSMAHAKVWASENYRLTVGANTTASGFAAMVWLFTIVLDRAYTTADKAAIGAWARRHHATVDA